MNGFRILQDLSHMLPAKTLQHETHVSGNVFKRRLWNFFNLSRKNENALESRGINSSTLSNDMERISATWTAIPEITAITFNFRSPAHFLHPEENAGKRLEALKPLIKYDELPSLLDGNPISRNKCRNETLSNVQAGDFGFVRDNSDVIADKAYLGDYTSKIVSTLEENQESIIDRTIEPVPTDNLSIRIIAKNVNSLSPVTSGLRISEINQQPQKYDSSQSPELQFQDHTQGNLLSNTAKQQIQQRSQITERILQTPTIIFESLSPLFESMQRSNTITKTKNCTNDAARLSTMFAETETLHKRSVLSKRFSTKPSPRREYHTWKISGIKNDVMKRNDRSFSISNIRTTQQEQGTPWESFQLNRSIYSGSLKNQNSRIPSSSLSSIPRRVFSSKSCSVTQRFIQNVETTRKDLSANVSIVRWRSTRSPSVFEVSRDDSRYLKNSSRVSLIRLQSFSCDASKSKKSCEKDDRRESRRSEREIERKARRKDTCDRDSLQDGKCEKQRGSKSESCKRYICPEMKRRVRCSWEKDQCPEARQKCNAKERRSMRDHRRQSRDPDCSREQTVDAKCSEGRKSRKGHKDCEKTDESRAICKDSLKKKKDCQSKDRKSKYEKRCEKRNIRKKGRRNCTGNSQKRSKSNQKRNSYRVSDESCRKIDGKRRYSQQSIFSVLQNHRSFSTLIPDTVLGIDVNKITRRLYADCSKDKKRDLERSCVRQKRKCETGKKVEIEKKCVTGPAKCLPRKSTVDKTQTCESTRKDKEKQSRELTEKICSHEEYCANRKKELSMKDKKSKEYLVKEHSLLTMKEKKPKEESMKEQIAREYKEIGECKKGLIKEKKDDKTKKTCTEYKRTSLNRAISPWQRERNDSENLASTLNASIFSNFTSVKPLSIQSTIINDEIPIIIKNVRLFDVMFDRSFSTTGMSNYQDDFATKRAAAYNKILQNCFVNNSDLYADELPNYIEIESDGEEEDSYDKPLVDQSPKLTES